MIFGVQIGFLDFTWKDALDIFLVAILLSQVYKLMRGSVAIKVFVGFLILYLIYLVINAMQMELLSAILGQFMGLGMLAVIVLFQQEIRKFLLMMGKTNIFEDGKWIKSIQFWGPSSRFGRTNITSIVEAAKEFAATHTGALMVFSSNSPLKFYAASGDAIDALLSKRLLLTIFNKNSPIHDGAVIIHKNRIVAAGCVLPLTERSDIPAQYGLRHRAGLGMSENTEVLVIAVSEETGYISTMQNGRVVHNISLQALRKHIGVYLSQSLEEPKKKEKTTAVKAS